MFSRQTRLFTYFLFISISWIFIAAAAAAQPLPEKQRPPAISLPLNVVTSFAQNAASVKSEITDRASSLFERTPMGWNWNTIEYLYKWALELPLKLPEIFKNLREQSRVLGAAGTFLVLIFLAVVLYSLLGRHRIMARIESEAQALRPKIPPTLYPFLLSALKVLVSSLIPLALFAAYSLINAMIHYRAAWFQLMGELMIIWVVGALLIRILRETLTQNLFRSTSRYGRRIYQLSRLAVLYALGGFAVIHGTAAFQIRPDVIALLKFALSVSIVVMLFLFHLKKTALMSLLPDLPYRTYQGFIRFLNRLYYPLVFFAVVAALLWCLGYRQLGWHVLGKLWVSGVAYIFIMLAYHKMRGWLEKWYGAKDASDEAARFFFRSLRSMLVYATALATVGIVFNLLGLMDLIQRLFSFSVMRLGTTQLTLWLIIKAVIILLAFVYAARLLQSYLDYKIYPSLGIDAGLAYALDTTLKYTFIVIGVLIALKVVGLDLRFLLVFAGAAGIGIGLGLQHLAANIISGFTIIFGGKIRKGDWIEVENKLAVVTDIYLRATKVKTRDNIEYIVPNSNLISNTIVNYSLASPLIRIDLPVGVSYSADPRRVKNILMAVAEKEPMVSKLHEPIVRFIEYGDSSINFELLIWIDVRETPRRSVRSALYFEIFEAFKKNGIEIPFPQRDLHIRSSDVALPS